MSGSQFIITGTSRGIGEQLAYMLLEKGHDVHGIARGTSERLSSIHYVSSTRILLPEVL